MKKRVLYLNDCFRGQATHTFNDGSESVVSYQKQLSCSINKTSLFSFWVAQCVELL